jgi:hypothetical protein
MRTPVGGIYYAMNVIGLFERGHFVMYMRSPLFASQLPPGKTWVRIDLQTQGKKIGIDFSSLLGSSEAIAPLWHGLVSTKRLGRQVVAGTRSTHYRATVDYQRAAAALPAFGDQLAAIERTTGVRIGQVNADVWVGTDGYVRRFRTVTPTVVQGRRGTSMQTITYTGYNVPVTIIAPPRASVVSFPG